MSTIEVPQEFDVTVNHDEFTITVSTPGPQGPAGTVSGTLAWGSLVGTLSDQLDLQAALDLKADSSTLTTHTSDSTIHFTAASLNLGSKADLVGSPLQVDPTQINQSAIDHTNLMNIGSYTHAQIDSHIDDATIHFTQASISITASQVSDFSTAADARIALATLSDLSDTDFAGSPESRIDGDVLTWNAAASKWQALALPSSSGEANTASNVGSGSPTVGVFKSKSGVDLQFKSLYEGSNLISIIDQTDQIAIDVNQANLALAASQSTIDLLGTPTYTTLQDLHNVTDGCGIITGFSITDGGSGTVDVAAGTGFIRAVDSEVATIYPIDVAGTTGLALTDGQINYIYVEYNAGTPQIVATVTERTDHETNLLLGNVYRNGTVVHINDYRNVLIVDGITHVVKRLLATEAISWESGALVSETGTRNFAITAGAFWEGLTRFTTNAQDTSAATGSPLAPSFSYFYRDTPSGWVEVPLQTQIDNLYYDDGTGTLHALTTNRYGVHWIYEETDSNLVVVYGQGDYTLAQAQDAQPPGSLPPQLEVHGILVGKIIIQQNQASFFSVESAFDTSFSGAGVSVHNDLSGIQGGTANEYYHLTNSDYTAVLNLSTSLAGKADLVGSPLQVDPAQINNAAITITASQVSDFNTSVDGRIALANLGDLVDVDFTGSPSVADGDILYYNGTSWINWVPTFLNNVVEDTTPQLGGNLDVNSHDIVSTSNGDINITPNGTGHTVITSPENIRDINGQSGTSYTLAATDAGQYVEMSNASANTVYVPANADVAFPVGTEIHIIQTGAGQTTIQSVGSPPVTINAANQNGSPIGALATRDKWSVVTLLKRATDTWVLFGDLDLP